MSRSGSVVLIVALVVVGIVLIHQSLAAGRPLGLGSTFASGSKLSLAAVGKQYRGNTAEDIFQRQWAVALKEFRQPRAPLSDIDLWDLFNPFYPCPLMERVGDILDGGKYVCARDVLLPKRDCNIYSLGSNGDTSFERGILERAPQCHFHVFDHTLDSARAQTVSAIEGVSFHLQGIASDRQLASMAGQPFTSIRKSMKENGIKWLDILKIDIEGYEWPVFAELLAEEEVIPFTQVLIELHAETIPGFRDQGALPKTWGTNRASSLFAFFNGMLEHGFRPFSQEPNMHSAQPQNVVEYSFVQTDGRGNIVTG